MKQPEFKEESKTSPAAGYSKLGVTIREHVSREGCPESEGMRTVGEGASRKWGGTEASKLRCRYPLSSYDEGWNSLILTYSENADRKDESQQRWD